MNTATNTGAGKARPRPSASADPAGDGEVAPAAGPDAATCVPPPSHS